MGEWSLVASNNWNNSQIYSFEILSKHWKSFLCNTKYNPNIVLNQFGLSDFEGEIKVYHNNNALNDSMATIYPEFLISQHKEYYNSTEVCTVKNGSQYLKEKEIQTVDLLKIDVEGHELKVLKGFGDSICKVRLIQFEYGVFNITSRDLLCDFFRYLINYNFIIGKIYPRYVDFFKYTYPKENFLWGNYVAVNRNDKELIKLLEKF